MKDLFIRTFSNDAYGIYLDCPIGYIPELLGIVVFSDSVYPDLRYYVVLLIGDTETYKFATFSQCVSFIRDRISCEN